MSVAAVDQFEFSSRKRHRFRAFWAGLCLLALAGCAGRDEITVIKLGHGLDQTHPVHRAMSLMAQRVAEKSNGRMRIDIYSSGQLGTERECLELLQVGGLGMTKTSASVLEGFAPAYGVFSLPYLFRDEEHQFRVLEGPIGREFLLSTEAKYLRGLCFYDAGSRSFYTKHKPIQSPDDLAGLKIRTQESAMSVRFIQVLGGSATPIAWGELYTSLQQGVVDGAENNPPSFHLSRHYEVCPYYTLDEHTSVPDVLLVSTHVWNRLTGAEQQILEAAAAESMEHQKKIWKEASDTALREVEKAGVKIIHPDKQAFREKVQPLYEQLRHRPLLHELVTKIQSTP